MPRRGPKTGLSDDPKGGASATSGAGSWTFVNQADDPESLSHRKISNKEKRHVIRSHVMQRVRQLELSVGKTRSTDRKNTKKTSGEPSQSCSNEPVHKDETEVTIPDFIKQESNESSSTLANLKEVESPFMTDETQLVKRSNPLYLTPAIEQFDPFDTLPGDRVPHRAIESLMRHCFAYLLPQTFQAEFKRTSERRAKQEMVLKSKTTSPAVFLGFMGTVAAHRAIMFGSHSDLAPSETDHDDLIFDPDYKQVKLATISAVRKKIENAESLDQDVVDACFGLISTATMVGNFQEARTHLKGTETLMKIVGTTDESIGWVPIVNTKVSLGLLTKPVLNMPWERQPIPEDVQVHISAPAHSEMARLGTDFVHMKGVSEPLKSLSIAGRDICNFASTNAATPSGLPPSEMMIFTRKATELEFDLLSYPYEAGLFPRNSDGEPVLPALEQVIRMAISTLLCCFPHAILPSGGLGRALTHHSKSALNQWLDGRKAGEDVDELKVLTWALFLYSHYAQGQPEEDFFLYHLSNCMRKLWLESWEEVESTMYGFLYVPQLQANPWNALWERIVLLRHSKLQ